MYIKCNTCKWSQDDFYNEDYNPYNVMLREDADILFDKKLEDIITIEKTDKHRNFIGMEPMTYRQLLIYRLHGWAKRIENMEWITYDEYIKKNPNKKCPKCGNKLIED